MIKISVLIGTRNRPEALKRCLMSVLEQDYSNFEVLILDDASDSCNICDCIRGFVDSRVWCFRVPQSLGVAGGRNLLMELAQGDVFCVIDDDAYFDDSLALTRIAEIFARNPDIGIVAVKVINHQNDKTELLVPFPKLVLKRRPGLVNEARDVSYFLGTCHAIRREVIGACGPYQPDLVYGEEELDLSYRVVEAGFRIRYVPDIVVHHYPQSSVVKGHNLNHPELYYHIRNRIMLARKYLPLPFAAFYLVFWVLRCFVFALRSGALQEFGKGVTAGIQLARQTARTPLSRHAVRYLCEHYGRLWF